MLAAIIPYTLQYLLSPVVFLLTFILPVVLAVTVEVIINWVNFCYYESRGLMILFTFVQIAVMAILILILKAIGSKAEG